MEKINNVVTGLTSNLNKSMNMAIKIAFTAPIDTVSYFGQGSVQFIKNAFKSCDSEEQAYEISTHIMDEIALYKKFTEIRSNMTVAEWCKLPVVEQYMADNGLTKDAKAIGELQDGQDLFLNSEIDLNIKELTNQQVGEEQTAEWFEKYEQLLSDHNQLMDWYDNIVKNQPVTG